MITDYPNSIPVNTIVVIVIIINSRNLDSSSYQSNNGFILSVLASLLFLSL